MGELLRTPFDRGNATKGISKVQSSTQRSAIDQTLDVSPIDSPHVPSDRHAVAIVKGSAPELSRETNDLLR